MILTGLLMVVILGFGALAIDIGHIMVVRNELKIAADAGAAAGARGLTPYVTVNPPLPNWGAGQAAATNATKANKTDKNLITDCQVQVGYWNIASSQLQPTTVAPTAVHVPAVKVTVSRAPGENTGSVPMFLAGVLGISTMDQSATSTAMIACPSTGPGHTLFPVAINYNFVQKYFDQNTQDPNNPIPFYIGSDYHYDGQEAGQWTSFFDVNNDASTIRSLIYGSNPQSISIGQQINVASDIWIQPGTKNSLYSDVATKIGDVVWVPVVPVGFETHAWNPVICYLPIKIEDSVGKNQKYIKAHFVRDAIFPSNNVGGPCFGAYGHPRLVQ